MKVLSFRPSFVDELFLLVTINQGNYTKLPVLVFFGLYLLTGVTKVSPGTFFNSVR